MKCLLYFSREEAAIKELVGVTKDTRIGGPLEGAHVHIAHLSDSSASLDLIKVLCAYFHRLVFCNAVDNGLLVMVKIKYELAASFLFLLKSRVSV